MNIKRAKQEIKDTIQAYLLRDDTGAYAIPSIRQRPVLLIGPPGVGKTQIMEQISQEMEIGLVAYTITHHTRQSAVGLPFIEKKQYGGREYTVTEYTMSEIVASIYDKIESTGLEEGILFIDEINCVSETLAPTMLQFLQCKTFGSHRIPEGWIIVTAGNPPEYNKSVREFDVVTLDRIKKITVEPDFEVWKEYAYRENIHPAILSYLGIKRQNFCQIETTVDGKRFATPRGWEDLSELICVYERLEKKADRDVVGQYIQFPAIAKDFANYLELYYKYRDDYQVDQILAGIISEALCDKVAKAAFDEKLSVVGLLLSRLSGAFRELRLKERQMELVMNGLKEFQKWVVTGAAGGVEHGAADQGAAHAGRVDPGKACAGLADSETVMTPAAVMTDLAARMEQEINADRSAGLLSRREEAVRRSALMELENYGKELAQMDGAESADGAAAWEQVRGRFGRASDRYEEQRVSCGEMLEHAFDFMEAAFGDSQEMVIFVTELNTNEYCVRFLQDYDCERYYQYNKRLLFDDEEQRLRARI